MTLAETERLLTVTEVAEAVRVSEKTLRRWIAHGKLEAIQLPNSGLRIRFSEYMRLVHNRKIATRDI